MKINIYQKISRNIHKIMYRGQRKVGDFYFVYFCISAIALIFISSPILYYHGLIRPAFASLVCACVVTSLLAMWRLGYSRAWLIIIFQISLISGVIYTSYFTGGINSPVMIWMAIIPVLPVLTLSRRSGYISIFISLIILIIIYLIQINGWIPDVYSTTDQDLTLSVLMIGTFCASLLMLIKAYNSIHAVHLSIIEQKNTSLKNLTDNLQLADKHKDKFMLTVSHEMRTPLNAIMGYLSLLRSSENISQNQLVYVEGAQSASSHLLAVINDLLDFSQIQKGKLLLRLQVSDLHQVINTTHKSLESNALSREINYELIIEDNVPQWVNIDPHRLAQIMLNLLGNALKFTEKGQVITRIKYEPNNLVEKKGFLLLQVQDTGVGIPNSFFKDIFEPFSQLSVHLNNDNSLRGNGLGLSITKTLVSCMDGQINLESKEGVGSIFKVRLPIDSVSSPSKPINKAEKLEINDNFNLLIVDDHATNRMVTSAIILQDIPHCTVDQANNGAVAIEKMKTNKYDLVLMDIIMPDYSGVEVARIIRKECIHPYSNVKIVALTANTSENLMKECMEVGIDEILRKPFERSMLIKTIAKNVNLT